MAYVKTNWQTGDVITAAKLNNMETGIYDATEAAAAAFAPDIDDPQDGNVIKYDGTAGKWVNGTASGGMVVPVLTTADQGITWTCSHTYAEIAALITAGKCNQIKRVEEGIPGSVYETLVYSDSSQIIFADYQIDGDGARMTNYIITSESISEVESQYPQPQNP